MRWLPVAPVLLLMAGLACSQGLPPASTPKPPAPAATFLPATRVLSISASPRLIPTPTALDWLSALELAHDAGARGAYSSWRWSELEPTPGTYDLKKVKDDLEFQAGLRGLEMLIGIQVINTTARELPADLRTTPFDSPQVMQRFHQLVDALLPFLDPHVLFLSVGNEVDIYLAAHPEEWAAYRTFYEDASGYLHSVAPWIEVGVTETFSGAVGPAAEQAAALNTLSDVVIYTYYPLQGRFQVRSPESPKADFPRMVTMAGGRAVILQEVGYPTAERLSSSEQAQADFVTNVLQAWRAEGERIPFLNYFLLDDLTPDLCGSMADYYQLHDADFEAFLCSLGLRTADGTAKLGWDALVKGAQDTGLP